MSITSKFINIGIVAHVDAGKTSITELFLHKSGVISSIGSVDKGTSQTDWLSVEKERGISVRSASASFEWRNAVVNLIDTPGHVDFSSEVERSMRVMDCAILVISAAEGVQGHTLTLWEALQKLNIPTTIFINKIDRAGSNIENVISDIKKDLSNSVIEMQTVLNEGDSNVSIVNSLDNKSLGKDVSELIIENDDNLMEKYLDGISIEFSELIESLKKQIVSNSIYPIYSGSAKYDIGINELLNSITNFLPRAKGDINEPVSGIIYKIEHDNNHGKIASVRLFNGAIRNRDLINIGDLKNPHKVTSIRKFHGQKNIIIGELVAGDVAGIYGLSSAKAGDIIGDQSIENHSFRLNTPMLKVKVLAVNNTDYSILVDAMYILSDEDPNMELEWLQDERELHIKILGIIQLQILKSILNDRFSIEVEFGKPTVIYKETPSTSFIAFEEYTMPKPCWAVVRFDIEPGERGSGIKFYKDIGVNKIAMRYQQEVERAIPKALQQGILGWEITDIKITLIGDEDHNIHSRAGDFEVATNMAIMKGLNDNGSNLLEPILEYKIKAHEEKLGVIVSSLTKLRAEIGSPIMDNGKFILTGTIPVSTSLEYSTTFSSITSGKGNYSTKFKYYKECPIELGVTTEYRGVNPLDRAKYILKARKALG